VKIVLEGGKYELVFDAKGLRASRHGEPWRDLTGDKLVLALMQRIEELEGSDARLDGLREALEIAKSHATLHDASPTTGEANNHGWLSACNGIAGALKKRIETAGKDASAPRRNDGALDMADVEVAKLHALLRLAFQVGELPKELLHVTKEEIEALDPARVERLKKIAKDVSLMDDAAFGEFVLRVPEYAAAYVAGFRLARVNEPDRDLESPVLRDYLERATAVAGDLEVAKTSVYVLSSPLPVDRQTGEAVFGTATRARAFLRGWALGIASVRRTTPIVRPRIVCQAMLASDYSPFLETVYHFVASNTGVAMNDFRIETHHKKERCCLCDKQGNVLGKPWSDPAEAVL